MSDGTTQQSHVSATNQKSRTVDDLLAFVGTASPIVGWWLAKRAVSGYWNYRESWAYSRELLLRQSEYINDRIFEAILCLVLAVAAGCLSGLTLQKRRASFSAFLWPVASIVINTLLIALLAAWAALARDAGFFGER